MFDLFLAGGALFMGMACLIEVHNCISENDMKWFKYFTVLGVIATGAAFGFVGIFIKEITK